MASPKELRLKQSATFKGSDWWNWAVWLAGPKEELDQVEYVEYTLHPTFPNPVRKISDRTKSFKLSTGGWGVFTIYAKAVKKDGTSVCLEHDLELRNPDGTLNTK